MKQPDQVLASIRTRYNQRWRDWLVEGPSGQMSWSLGAPSADEIFREPSTVHRWLLDWRAWLTGHAGVSLRPRELRTRLGPQTVYTHLDVPDLNTLAALDPDLDEHWRRANQRFAVLREIGATLDRIRPRLREIIDLSDSDFTILTSAVRWFTAKPRSGYSVRQVPVPGMHTKWLARNRGLVLAVLGFSDGTDSTADGELHKADLDLLGLRALPPRVDIILADPADQARHGGVRHIQAPVNEVAKLRLNPARVLIVENRESALIVPDIPGLVIIHSLGNNLPLLSTLPWLDDAICWYWGDLDRAGLTLLSRARGLIPSLRSVLMEIDSYDRFAWLAVREDEKVDAPAPTLTPDELAVLGVLTASRPDGYPRLEQERIDPSYAVEVLRRHLS